MNITKKFGKKAIAFVLVVAVLVGILATNIFSAAITFTDVPKDRWYYADVTELASKGVVSGVGNNKFEPERTVANAEMIKMVVNAFFRTDYNSFEAAHFESLRTRFGNNLYWYSFMAYYAKMNEMNGVCLLDGIDVDIDSYASCYQPMTRNDMAMILANAAKAKGIAPTEAQKAAVQADIKDYARIPAKYQDAVKTCFALKTKNASGVTKSLLEGDNGYFYGRDGASFNMTRAEACAVIVRLDNLIANGGTMVDPDPTPSTPDEPTVKDIVVTSAYWSGNATDEKGQPTTTSGTAWTITDNGFGNGRLNNGKPITEENVIELLHEAEKVWPANMTWSNKGSGNNFYKSSGTVVSRMMKTANTGAVHDVGSNFGCGGYAAMISDYLFGRSSNDFHRVTDPAAIRPGDIIIQINTSTNYVSHVIVAVTAPGGSYTGLNGTTNANRAGYIHFTDGNNGNMVNWPGIYSAPTNASIVDGETWQIYSRYPA